MKYLLIDSCIYMAENFKFNTGLLKYITKLCQQDKVKLLYCDIIYKEVLSLIENRCKDFQHNISSALKSINFLNDENEYRFISNIKMDNLSTLAKNHLDEYLKNSKAILLEQDVNIKTILDDYFESNPPFCAGNKKYEFPDAIILHSLEKKQFDESDTIFVLSTDNDWAKFISGKSKYQFYDDFYKCILELSSEEDQSMLYDDQLCTWIKKDENINEVNNLLENELFRNFDVSNVIEDAEIVDNNSSISLMIDPRCVYFDRENNILDFDISFITNVDFITEGLDYENAYYDREDREYYNLNTIMLHYTGKVQGVAVISLDVSFKKKHHNIINKIRDIEIFQDEINNSKENINIKMINND